MQQQRQIPVVLVGLVAVALFAIWSNSFIAIGYLLGSEGVAARFNWLSLTVARFVPSALLCAIYCFGFHRRQALNIVRCHWRRLVLCGLFSVAGYNFALYYGQQHGVPAPIASLETALAPLFLMILAVLFLGERLTRNRIVGFLVALLGILLISQAKDLSGAVSYPLLVGVTALAPLSWSVFSILSKPLTGRYSPVLWTYLAILFGTAPLLLVLPSAGWPQMRLLDEDGWLALTYLALLCTVLGFALWSWLLKQLPASVVGFTIFLNPPLTAMFKFLLAGLFPDTFRFAVTRQEWFGGGLALLGLAIALTGLSGSVGRARRRTGSRRRPPDRETVR